MPQFPSLLIDICNLGTNYTGLILLVWHYPTQTVSIISVSVSGVTPNRF